MEDGSAQGRGLEAMSETECAAGAKAGVQTEPDVGRRNGGSDGRQGDGFDREGGTARSKRFSRQLQGLLEISYLVGSVMEIDDILDQIARLTAEMFNTPVCSIYLFGPRREHLTLRASTGLSPKLVGTIRSPVGRGLTGYCAEAGEMVALSDAAKDPRYEPLPGPDEKKYRALIGAPLRIQEEVIGIMIARREDVHEFSPEERTLFEMICKQVAIVIEKSKMYYDKVEADRLAAISISLSEVAHYIKNLLQGMKGGMYFLDRGFKRGELEEARKGWEVLQRGNRKIASLVENMLNYSREIRLDLQPRDVNSIVYDILEQIDDSAVERGVAVVPETHRDLPKIPMDHDRIYDAVLNLVTNAIDAIPPDRDDGLVIVRTRMSPDGRCVEIAVEDNGVGMSPETQKKAFNLFFSTKGDKGSGIGLAVTRKVIEQHNGRISVNADEGRGAAFLVQLPLDPGAGRP